MADEVLVADASGRFAVELEEPAAAGYSWTPRALPARTQLEGEQVEPSEALGGVSRHVFRFASAQAGRHQLDFELRRPWEEQAAETRPFEVQVGA